MNETGEMLTPEEQVPTLEAWRELVAWAYESSAGPRRICEITTHYNQMKDKAAAQAARIAELQRRLSLLEEANGKLGCQLMEHSGEVNRRGERIAQLEAELRETAAALAEERRKEVPISTRYTEEQKAAIAKAIFDNDYSEMNRLKSLGRWLDAALAEKERP